MKSQLHRGFTLIEMLASIAIMGLFITVIVAPITQLFRNTNKGNQVLRATTQAQEIAEYIRGQWQSYPANPAPDAANNTKTVNINEYERIISQNRYDRTCFSLPTIASSAFMSFTVSIRSLDLNGTDTGALSYTTCPTPLTPTNPISQTPMKRVTVTVTTSDGSGNSILVTDIPRPKCDDLNSNGTCDYNE